MEKIDFVLLWVDGSDPAWLKEKNEYSPQKEDYSSSANRFRDWDNLQYWFRAVETYAPWVNQIFFVTWGHVPAWLNTSHPKLKIVNHKDFIPEKYLPTFNSDTIETNLHRIPELSEHFVLFNDDIFLTDAVKPEDFFIQGKPCDTFVESLIAAVGDGSKITHTKANITDVINAHFKKRAVHKKLFKKIYSPKYGLQNLITLYFLPFPYFTGFRNPHLAAAHLKSTFETVWKEEPELLNASCENKFRGFNDISHWLMRYWNLCTGNFVPRNIHFGRYFEAKENNAALCAYIKEHKGKMVCINDMSTSLNFEKAKREINGALETILPVPSSFEKQA